MDTLASLVRAWMMQIHVDEGRKEERSSDYVKNDCNTIHWRIALYLRANENDKISQVTWIAKFLYFHCRVTYNIKQRKQSLQRERFLFFVPFWKNGQQSHAVIQSIMCNILHSCEQNEKRARYTLLSNKIRISLWKNISPFISRFDWFYSDFWLIIYFIIVRKNIKNILFYKIFLI